MSAALAAKLPDWPRLLGPEQAAAYLGVSAGTFSTHVTVKPVRMGRRVLYDRLELDRFVDTLTGRGAQVGRAEKCDW